ncbi:MAG: ABC transporter substrate binding protein [Desulfobulbaceae bacterium]|nr:ABC transporter substrate binding protein [Desulfobulbaceae bacterium]
MQRSPNTVGRVVIFLVAAWVLLLPGMCTADQKYQGRKILVVMSYDLETKMEKGMQQTFDDLLPGAELQYVWLNAKKKPQQATARAEEAFRLFQEFNPDVVVAVNDNVQELFVVPYLKNKVSTPVVFAGVNDDADKYGFPADNVTGVLEKKHYKESISFIQLIDPGIQTIGIIYPDNLSQQKNIEQINREKETYAARVSEIVKVNTVDELEAAIADLSSKIDAFLIFNPVGIRDRYGKAMSEKDLYRLILQKVKKPTLAVNDWEVEAGILCGVIKDNNEQASLAVETIDKLFAGQPIKDIAISANKNGRRYINIVTMKDLGLKPAPQALVGTKIVSSQTGI